MAADDVESEEKMAAASRSRAERLESGARSGERAGQGLGFEDSQRHVHVITLQRPPFERQPSDHCLCEFPMNAQRHIVPRVVGENGERQLRRAFSLGSPIEPFRSVVPKVTSRIERFAIDRHTAARALADAPEHAHQSILSPTSGPLTAITWPDPPGQLEVHG